ncbi:hypothetical protein PFFCH_05662 [Plasmodium falciparum FCH/4]|uniref:Uncharacterized protein n=1 Tax=Plasmodium falciparum FCH/4 TaxID=1036724 RepID=A0A024VG57_PLAFA|nr:hypothetical protein PFFCH_05662 [Plasmodium falciparum FCH/4]
MCSFKRYYNNHLEKNENNINTKQHKINNYNTIQNNEESPYFRLISTIRNIDFSYEVLKSYHKNQHIHDINKKFDDKVYNMKKGIIYDEFIRNIKNIHMK